MKNKILLLISTWSLVMSPVFGQTVSELAGVAFTINTRDSESDEWLIGGLFEVDTRDRFEFSLSSNSVLENQGAGIEVGSFRSSSANTVTYSLVSGEGSSENDHFTLSVQGVLGTAKALDYEQTQEYSIRVLATAPGSIPTEKVFSIVVLDVDEGIPLSFVLSPNSIEENRPGGSRVGRFVSREENVQEGLVSWFEFGGDFENSVPNGSPGKSEGTSLVTDRNGQDRQALYFDGTNDTFLFELQERYFSNFTVCFWADPRKETSIVGESTRGGAMATPRHSTLMYYPMGDKTLHQVGFGIALGPNALNVAHLSGGRAPATLAYPSDLSGWKHYVVSCIDNKVRLFVNGEFHKDGIQFERTNILGPSITLGKNYKDGYFKGSIDDLRIYDRSITASEASSIYQSKEPEEAITYTLVKGEGDSGNRFFSLTPEGELKTAMVLDAGKSPSLSIRVQASQAGYETTEIFEVRVIENGILPPPEDPTKWKEKWEQEMAKLSTIRQEIEDTNKSVLEVDEALTRQTEEIRNLESQITEIEEAKLACDTECAQVREEIESKKAGLEQIRMENQRAENRISGLEDDLGKWITKDSELSVQITQKRTELSGLEDKLRIPYLKGWHYTEEKGWLWTDLEFYPMVYSDTQGIWLEYAQGTSYPWQYYDHYSEQWQEWK